MRDILFLVSSSDDDCERDRLASLYTIIFLCLILVIFLCLQENEESKRAQSLSPVWAMRAYHEKFCISCVSNSFDITFNLRRAVNYLHYLIYLLNIFHR